MPGGVNAHIAIQRDADESAYFAVNDAHCSMEGAIEPYFVDMLLDDIRKPQSHRVSFATTDFRNGRLS